jgi:hypothetical protein
LASVGGIALVVGCSVFECGPKRAVDIGDSIVDSTAGKSAPVTIPGRITLKVDVKGHAVLYSLAEGGTSLDIIRVELFVGQIITTADSSFEPRKLDVPILRLIISVSSRLPRKAEPLLPGSNGKITAILVINKRYIEGRPTSGQ